ncbi:Acetylcholinesterase-1 [Araneus ventricosus]|uniref:Acetylcholinesterase-1 n=1 Tax=Araneus ventricosus TaxID=182803 RepID=A0A4Y2P3H1_ARAVE|nr:Acetylcholinesterase-1 [Araneus ventricosus]GBN46337.1 Acetylcholinesterase-1 [Araneus ventricosus]GBN46428.1 Acetylcholinesterase-1 [Araneus ventricosus]GBN46457.1 Acetylcholinesterase-1 [Araneus ventricosus]
MGVLIALLFALSILACVKCQTDSDTFDDPDAFGPDDLDDGVKTKSGKIIGKITQYYGGLGRAFLGVPYAKPPVGELRFKKPEAVEQWSDDLIADTMPPACVQHSRTDVPWYDSDPGQSEDCLYMNIWMPRGKFLKKKFAVMLWIYGGGFTVGSNRLPATDGQGLSTFAASIVVSPNYRVGAMGFLSSGTDDAPGNMGIYDILMAVKWIRENIEAFNGDPDNIVIFGQGSGAITVSMLLMSPLSQGLFTRAIIQSGSFLSIFQNPNEYNLNLGQRLAENVDCASANRTLRKNPKEVVECLRDVDASTLAEVLSSLQPGHPTSFLPQYGDEFMPKNPKEYLMSGKFKNVPILIGTNKHEGSYLLTTQYPELFGSTGDSGVQITKSFGETVLRRWFSLLGNPEDLIEQYLGDLEENDTNKVRKQVFTALGDFSVTCPTVYFAETYSGFNNSVKFYVYEHRPYQSPWSKWMGTTHYDEVPIVFARPMDGYTFETFLNAPRDDELDAGYAMSKMWGDFAREGKIMKTWTNYSKYHHQYVHLKPQELLDVMHGPGPHLDNCEFLRRYFES